MNLTAGQKVKIIDDNYGDITGEILKVLPDDYLIQWEDMKKPVLHPKEGFEEYIVL